MGLLSDICDREDEGKIAIDADSILYLSCWRYKDDWNIELAYFDFCERIGTIKTACYEKVCSLTEVVLSFTSKTNFRYDLYPDYKANRKTDDEKANLLNARVKELKVLIYTRLGGVSFESLDIHNTNF